jgi:hypothetical protein
VVQHVRTNLPHRHHLHAAGWTALPDNIWALANDVAMPGTFTD